MTFYRFLCAWLTAWLLTGAGAACAQILPGPDANDGVAFRVLTFHDVRKNVRESFITQPDPFAVDESTLLSTFAWLRDAGYTPVSLQQIIDARAGGRPLPDNPVLLSFDDGYESAYSIVYPLLKRFKYPAVFSLVTEWMNVPAGELVPDFSRTPTPREHFMTWEQAAEVARSGWVELAGHSHGLHRGVIANPQGNLLPAATSRRYDVATATYESDAEYEARIRDDLRENKRQIESKTGVAVRALVWPYGAFNRTAVRIAEQVGLPYTFSLEDGPNTADVPNGMLRRSLVSYDAEAPDLLRNLRPGLPAQIARQGANRIMHVDLDYLYDEDPVQQNLNLSRLLDRVHEIRPTSVFLQAFADPDGDGVADALYFPSRRMPMRADLFNRVAWQLRTRTSVRVYAWMPVTAFELPAADPAASRKVQVMPGAPAGASDGYLRLSPFDPVARQAVLDIYGDLGRYTSFGGILFHDDAMLNDFEDASPAALATYEQWGFPPDVATIRADPDMAAQWSRRKTQYLIKFTQQLTDVLRHWQPGLLTARNMYAAPLLTPASEAWFAQNYADFLKAYDFTAIEAMPYMENAPDADAWLTDLVNRVAARPGAMDGTLFELQARDWRTNQPIPDDVMQRHFELLRRAGARHIGHYPDDFLVNQPAEAMLKRQLSTQVDLTKERLQDPINTPAALGDESDPNLPPMPVTPGTGGTR